MSGRSELPPEPENKLDEAASRAAGSPPQAARALLVAGFLLLAVGLLMIGAAVWAYRGQGPIFWTLAIVLALAGLGLAGSARRGRLRRTPHGYQAD